MRLILPNRARRRYSLAQVFGGQTKIPMRRLRAAILYALAASMLAGAPAARAQRDDNATITAVGCLDGEPDSLRFEDGTGVYRLTGNTAPLAPYIGKAVEIKGVPHSRWLATPGRAIEVVNGSAFANPPPATLDSVIGDPARWHNYIDRRDGLSLEFPGEKSPAAGSGPRTHLPLQDEVSAIHRSVIPSGIFPGSDFTGGYLAVFTDRDITDADRCAAASPRSSRAASAAPNVLTIAGVDYNAEHDTRPGAGSMLRSEYMRTFHNRICYEFAFLFELADREEYGGMDCMVRSADPSQIARLIISQVSFFPPEIRRVASRAKHAR